MQKSISSIWHAVLQCTIYFSSVWIFYDKHSRFTSQQENVETSTDFNYLQLPSTTYYQRLDIS